MKVTIFGVMPSFCICLKQFNALCPCPCWVYPEISAFHDATSRKGISSSTCCAFDITPHYEYKLINVVAKYGFFSSNPFLRISLCRVVPARRSFFFADALSKPKRAISSLLSSLLMIDLLGVCNEDIITMFCPHHCSFPELYPSDLFCIPLSSLSL